MRPSEHEIFSGFDFDRDFCFNFPSFSLSLARPALNLIEKSFCAPAIRSTSGELSALVTLTDIRGL